MDKDFVHHMGCRIIQICLFFTGQHRDFLFRKELLRGIRQFSQYDCSCHIPQGFLGTLEPLYNGFQLFAI